MGKKKQTVGWRYYLDLLWGMCRAADELVEIRVSNLQAWFGSVTTNQRITIDKPNLMGGDKSEGGIVGDMDIMFGGPTQAPSDYLANAVSGQGKQLPALFGFGIQPTGTSAKPVPAMRKRVMALWRGGQIGSNNPYPKPWAFRWRRHLKGWQNDTPWYPAKAVITMQGKSGPLALSKATLADLPKGSTVTVGTRSTYTLSDTPSGSTQVNVAAVSGIATGDAITGPAGVFAAGTTVTLSESVTVKGMNPAHILYESITNAEWGKGDPVSLINDASFTAAADTLYSEGFGLCLEYSAPNETIEQFQQRVLDHIGAGMTKSLVDGQWYLDLIRDNYDPATLPLIDESAVISLEELSPAGLDGVNQVIVQYTDPLTRTQPTTRPAQARGAMVACGRVVSHTQVYDGIATADLADRVTLRDLRATATPLLRLKIVCNRTVYKLRRGQAFRFSYAPRGISEVVFRLGDIGYGTLTDGRITLTAVQDVFGMPDASFSTTQAAGWQPADTSPQLPPAHMLLEASYRDLALRLSAADLGALDVDAGYVHELATRPSGAAVNYQLQTRLSGGTFANVGTGDFCPVASLGAAMPQEAGPTAVTLTGMSDVDLVEVGTAALVDNEICRVDAIDAAAGTATLARGCVDTVPDLHAAGAAVYFFEDYTGEDTTEYATGETVEAMALTRTTSDQLAVADAATDSAVLNQRQARPYPPGGLTINGAAYPDSAQNGLSIGAAHRDRVTQADQLVDTTAADIGPEAGVTYTANAYIDGVLDKTVSGATAFPIDMGTLSGSGAVEIDVYAVNNGLMSWQPAHCTFDYTITNILQSYTLRLKASDIVANDGDPVATWSAETGSDATQATASAQPTYAASAINGHPAVRFDGSASYMQGAAIGVSGKPAFTVFIVLGANTLSPAGAQRSAFMFGNTSSTPGGQSVSLTADTLYSTSPPSGLGLRFNNGNNLANYVVGSPIVLVARMAQGATYAQSDIFVNGTLQTMQQNANGSYKLNMVDQGYLLGVGKFNGGLIGFANFDIAELVFFNKALSDSDVASMVTSLRNDYGI